MSEQVLTITDNNTGTNATAAHRHSAWCTLSGPGHKLQNRYVHRRRSVDRSSASLPLLLFCPSICLSHSSTHLFYITLRLLPTLHLISVLSVLPCPHSSALFHCLPHRFPSSVFRLLPLLLFSLFPLPYSFLSTCSFLLSSPHHLPVVLSPLFFFFPLFSPPLPPLPAPALSARLLHPTSPPSPTFSNTPLRHTSPPSFLRHTFLLHSSSTPFPLFRFFSLGFQTSSLSPLFSLPPLFSSSLRHTLLLPFSLAPLASHITPSERSHPRGAKSTHLQTSRIFIALQILFQSRHYRPTTFALQDKPSVNPGSSIHLSTSYQHIINLSTMHFYLTCTTQRHRTSGCRFG